MVRMADHTVIQYHNKTVIHSHDHVHLHGPTDGASMIIAIIVTAGFVIGMIIVACLVSIRGLEGIWGQKKRGGASLVGLCQSYNGLVISYRSSSGNVHDLPYPRGASKTRRWTWSGLGRTP